MKKILTFLLVTGLVLSAGVFAFADSILSPAEIYGSLTGKTVEESYELKGNDKTFGELADEAGVFDEFQAEILEAKKEIIADRVEKGLLTQDEADELLELIENSCDGTGSQRLGKGYGIGFGNGLCSGAGNGLGRGRGAGMGRGYGLGRNN